MSKSDDRDLLAGKRWYERGWPLPFALGFIIFSLLSGAAAFYIPPGKEQPIVFNHQKHVQENEMECSECHEYYERETFSGVPTVDTCSFCHSEALGESAEERRLVKLIEEGGSLDWEPLFQQPPHVFYSHRRHTTVAQIDCAVCHGSIGDSTVPPARVTQLTMEDCIDCHEKEQAAADCTTCHR